jgi:hypothetical protein
MHLRSAYPAEIGRLSATLAFLVASFLIAFLIALFFGVGVAGVDASG